MSTWHSFPSGKPEAECVRCGIRFDSFYGIGCQGDIDRALAASEKRELAMRTASEALVESLGEYVRQSMHFNPEWRTGLLAVQDAIRASARTVRGSVITERMAFEIDPVFDLGRPYDREPENT